VQHEPSFRPSTMNDAQRRQFVQKAKADRLAFDAAQFLAHGDMVNATSAAGQCMTIAGRDQLEVWLRHYATTRFKVASNAVDAFLDGVPSNDVAL
jgi:hypothetical protein